jgi:3-phosphoshikimate 1-carboxyvinyltransferase
MTQQSQSSFHVVPGGRLQGVLRVPGDKSISHRAIILGAVADGFTEVSGFLAGEDNLATLRAFRAMGVEIEGPHAGQVLIHGVGLHGLRAAPEALDLGNSGTSMRLLAGLLAGQAFATVLVGDASLSLRPMRRVTVPLKQMGAHIETSTQGTPPLRLSGGQRLVGIDYALPVASAQVKSALLLAGLYADGKTCVIEPAPTRDHTERMLQALGYTIERREERVCISGGGRLRGTRIDVPADISSAAFFLVGAAIAPGSDLTLIGVGINPTRIGVINILRSMGAALEITGERMEGSEPVADLHIRYRRLHGIEIPTAQVPLAIDEFPALFIAAACAEGETVLRGAAELRVKESDRIQVMVEDLRKLGIIARPTADGMRIRGGNGFTGGRVSSEGDHRIAMAFAVSALRASEPVVIEDCAKVGTSFPGFIELAQQAGLDISQQAS